MSKFLQNRNGNLLCGIDLELTGSDPKKHDIVQIVVLPLTDDLIPCRHYKLFMMDIKPNRKENVEKNALRLTREQYCEVVTRGMESGLAAELFVEWFEKLNVGWKKRLMPVAYDWVKLREFLREWLGPLSFDLVFHETYRDVSAMATFCNDRASWIGNDFPYPKVDLTYLCSQLKVEYSRPHDVIEGARVAGELYRRIVKEFL